MLKVRYDPGKALYASGHAAYADPGQDIVCAGVSALVCALRAVSREEWYEAEGQACILLQPRDEIREWKAAADVIAGGIRMIAGQYPANVSYREV